jgi:hypothetical protein
MGYLHNPTDISDYCVERHLNALRDKNRIDPICANCVVQHLKVLRNKNRIDPVCEHCFVRQNLLDWVNRPLTSLN